MLVHVSEIRQSSKDWLVGTWLYRHWNESEDDTKVSAITETHPLPQFQIFGEFFPKCFLCVQTHYFILANYKTVLFIWINVMTNLIFWSTVWVIRVGFLILITFNINDSFVRYVFCSVVSYRPWQICLPKWHGINLVTFIWIILRLFFFPLDRKSVV